jgi:hypothetical protein
MSNTVTLQCQVYGSFDGSLAANAPVSAAPAFAMSGHVQQNRTITMFVQIQGDRQKLLSVTS